MNFGKKILSTLTVGAMLSSFGGSQLAAQEICVDNGGCGYTECCRTTSLAPAIALGTILLVAIVAVAVQNTSGHSHCHGHN